jgi:hypothetical protein
LRCFLEAQCPNLKGEGLQVANRDHVKLLKKSTAKWNAWRDSSPTPNLSGADLSNANLYHTNLYYTTPS